MTKKCTKCNNSFDIKFFHKYKDSPDGLDYRCNKCVAKQSKKWYRKNKKRVIKKQKERSRNLGLENPLFFLKNRLATVYKITLLEYNNLLNNQNEVCAICKNPEKVKNNMGKIIRLGVDHDHKTDKIRGLLCTNCNRGIGYLKENIFILKNAIKYLKRN